MPLQRLDAAFGVGQKSSTFRSHASSAPLATGGGELKLPGEVGAAALANPAGLSVPGAARTPQEVGSRGEARGKVLRVYKWTQFHGREEVTEFDEAHFAAEGIFEQNSSSGHKDYQDRLRAVHLRKEGMDKAQIAKHLGRSEKFVAKWWQKEVKEIPRPWGVHDYLTKNMGRNSQGVGATNGATMTDESANDTATWWRDVEVRRKFANDPSIYQDILNNTEWKPSNARTRDFATGAFHIKYDAKGNIKWEGHQGGKYKQGLSPAMDKTLQKLFAEYGIADRTSGIITNWYPDGFGHLGSHRHDCWTALFSFGHERILTIDNTPLLMQDGDLCIFGTQRHGVPIMPEITEGRITLVIFFYPNEMQKKGMWQTITDPETMEASAPLAKMLHEKKLGSAAENRASEHLEELQALQEMGFSNEDSRTALRMSGFDVQRAAEFLLMAGGGGIVTSTAASEAKRQWRICKGTHAQPELEESLETSCTSSSSSSTREGSSAIASVSELSDKCTSLNAEDSDESLARRLQLEEEGVNISNGDHQLMSDEEVAALALQLDEMDNNSLDPTMLAAQFEEYESRLNLEDAQHWNGHGDLMHSPFSREHLSIEKMDKVTIFSVGHGDLFEKDFWEVLQCNSIRVLYDVRQTDHRGELHARHSRFSTASLRSQCRTRGIFFKSMPIGRESAYGTLAHIKTDEGQHTLVELLWQANKKRTAFLGKDENWADDARQVVAEELAKFGHTVLHIRSNGTTEPHHMGNQLPDWLVREEDRLRMVEKKRQAGELNRPQKSRTDRSSEAVAASLSRPVQEIDAMQEMQTAANQKELVVAQRKLARYQRVAEEKGVLAAKVVTNTPQWILEDAKKQAEWVAAKKKEKAQLETTGPTQPSSAPHTQSLELAEATPSSSSCVGAATKGGSPQQASDSMVGMFDSVGVEEEKVIAQNDCDSAPATSLCAEQASLHASTCAGAQAVDKPVEVCEDTEPRKKSSWRARRRAGNNTTA